VLLLLGTAAIIRSVATTVASMPTHLLKGHIPRNGGRHHGRHDPLIGRISAAQ